jgi:hypothetical protein
VVVRVAVCELRGQGIVCFKLCQDLAGCQRQRKFDLLEGASVVGNMWEAVNI